jgi:hypothetical protein
VDTAADGRVAGPAVASVFVAGRVTWIAARAR